MGTKLKVKWRKRKCSATIANFNHSKILTLQIKYFRIKGLVYSAMFQRHRLSCSNESISSTTCSSLFSHPSVRALFWHSKINACSAICSHNRFHLLTLSQYNRHFKTSKPNSVGTEEESHIGDNYIRWHSKTKSSLRTKQLTRLPLSSKQGRMHDRSTPSSSPVRLHASSGVRLSSIKKRTQISTL